MYHDTQKLKTVDGLQLFTQRWLPEREPHAHLLIVHGFGEHSGRYEHVAHFFASRGFAVYAYDQRGYGRSEGKRAYVDRFELYLKDLGTVLDQVKAETRKAPLFLLGHSMGGTVVTLYVESRQPRLTGVLLSGPALVISKDISPFLQKISSVLGKWTPGLKTVKLDVTAISRDPAVVEAFENDPLAYHDGMYARTGAEFIRANRKAQTDMEKFKLPVLIMHGTADRLADPDGSRELAERAATADKTLKWYDGLFHELLNEPEKVQVMQDMLAWMEERVSG